MVYKLWTRLIRLGALVFMVLPGQVLAGGDGASGTIVLVADSRAYSGWRAWFTNLYNESHLYFTLVTIVTIPLLALILGSVMGFVMGRLGIDLKSRVMAEH